MDQEEVSTVKSFVSRLPPQSFTAFIATGLLNQGKRGMQLTSPLLLLWLKIDQLFDGLLRYNGLELEVAII